MTDREKVTVGAAAGIGGVAGLSAVPAFFRALEIPWPPCRSAAWRPAQRWLMAGVGLFVAGASDEGGVPGHCRSIPPTVCISASTSPGPGTLVGAERPRAARPARRVPVVRLGHLRWTSPYGCGAESAANNLRRSHDEPKGIGARRSARHCPAAREGPAAARPGRRVPGADREAAMSGVLRGRTVGRT